MSKVTAQPKRRIGLLIWMIVSQLLAIGSLWFWAVAVGLSVMAFDEGGSPEAWAFVLAVWAYPLFPLLMAIGAWAVFAFRKNRLATVSPSNPHGSSSKVACSSNGWEYSANTGPFGAVVQNRLCLLGGQATGNAPSLTRESSITSLALRGVEACQGST